MEKELREPFVARCHSCQTSFEIPEYKIPLIWKGQQRSAKDAGSIAVLCAACKQGHSYSCDDFPPLGMTDMPCPYTSGGSLRIFRVWLECDDENCRLRLEVLAPKKSHIDDADVKREMKQWNLSSLKCERDHQIVIPE